MAKFALAIDDAAEIDGCLIDGPTARTLIDAFDEEVLLLQTDAASPGYVGTARIGSIQATPELGTYRAMLSGIHRFPAVLPFGSPPARLPRLQLLELRQFNDILADAALMQMPSVPMSGFEDVAAADFAVGVPDLPVFEAVVKTLRHEVRGRCAITGAAVARGRSPVVINPKGAETGLHVNNLLLLSPAAEAAFKAGHISARDDFSLLVDTARIDPELLVRPEGRLLVPANPALQPTAENLGWHRREVFRLR